MRARGKHKITGKHIKSQQNHNVHTCGIKLILRAHSGTSHKNLCMEDSTLVPIKSPNSKSRMHSHDTHTQISQHATPFFGTNEVAADLEGFFSDARKWFFVQKDEHQLKKQV